MDNIMEIKNVTKSYGNKIALNNLNLKLNTGHIIGLLGPNGSGKTTLLKCLLHIIRPNSGELYINNNKVDYLTREYISYMPDREFLYDYMTIEDAIKYYQDMFSDFDINKAKELCVKLSLKTTDKIKKLSKGNREKVALILTLSRNTKIYLLDEPLGSLDPVIKHQMLEIIKEQKSSDRLILIATHLIKDTEEILDTVIFLKNGELAVLEDKDKIIKDGKTIEGYYLEVFLNA